MVQLTLPRNSKVKTGKVWDKPAGATNLREYRIYRWSPDDDENPSIDTYYVDTDDCGPMVLDGLIYIKNKIDPTLTFRRSCLRGHLRFVCDEHRRHQHAGLHQGHGRGERAGQDLPAAAHAGGEGSGAGPHTCSNAQHRFIEPWLKTVSPTPEADGMAAVP